MLPMMLPRCDFIMARGRALEANVKIAMVKTFPEVRCRRLPLRTAMAKVPASRPTVPPRMCRIKSGRRIGTRSDVSSQSILHVWSRLLIVGHLRNCLQLAINQSRSKS